MSTKWIGPFDYETWKLGDRAFLVRHTHHTKQWTRYDLRDNPPQTNQSLEPRIVGWCGTYNDVATHGEGLVKVVKIARNGRLQVQDLDDNERAEALEELGYPELI
jgi:hypothetical protein